MNTFFIKGICALSLSLFSSALFAHGGGSEGGGSALGQGQTVVSYSFSYLPFKTFDAETAHEIHEAGREVHHITKIFTQTVGVGYGFTDRFSLFAQIPHVQVQYRDLEDGPGRYRTRTNQGLGDTVITGAFLALDMDHFRLTATQGIKLPTGDTEVDHIKTRQEQEFQPGTGSVDYLWGLAADFDLEAIRAGAHASYRHNTKGAQKFTFGNSFSAGASLEYELVSTHELEVALATDLTWTTAKINKNREGHILDSGGRWLHFTPALHLGFHEMVNVEVAAPIPVHQNKRGVEQRFRTGVDVTVRFSF